MDNMVTAEELLNNKIFSDRDRQQGIHEGTHRSALEPITDAWDARVIDWAGKYYLVVGWCPSSTARLMYYRCADVPHAVLYGKALDGEGYKNFYVNAEEVVEEII